MGEDPRELIESIAERYLDQLQSGKTPDRAALLEKNPEIAEALELRLTALERIHRVARKMPAAELEEPEEKLPERIGRFQISGLLVRGSFGTVYKAYDAELDREVAIKVPRVGIFLSKVGEERFLREARSAARLKYPGIVAVYEIGFDDNLPFIVSEAING